jgi:hypothetical protein
MLIKNIKVLLLSLVLLAFVLHSTDSGQNKSKDYEKKPLANQLLRTALEGFLLGHVVTLLKNNFEPSLPSSENGYYLTSLSKAFRTHTFTQTSIEAPHFIGGLFLVKFGVFLFDPLLKKFI